MKRILKILVLLLVGASIGALGCWLYFIQSMRHLASFNEDIYASGLFTYELNEAEKQASNPNRDVAIYSLNRAVIQLQKVQPPRFMNCRAAPFRIAKLQLRLAHLYKEAGNTTERNIQLQSALSQYARMGWKLESVAELERALPLIEVGKTVEAIKSFGKSIEPTCRQ